MNNIIFLDIDGVLLTGNDFIEYHGKHGSSPSQITFKLSTLSLLKEIAEGGDANIVLSSSWRMIDTSIEFVKNELSRVGLETRYIGKTQYIPSVGRGVEISKWIKDNNFVGSYVILDDDSFDIQDHLPNLVVTKFKTGLTKTSVKKALKILQGRKGES